MNFVAHVLVADRLGGGPTPTLVGAAAPDLVRMAGVPLHDDLPPTVADGVAIHHRTDAVFHDLAWFRGTTRDLTTALTGRGVRRGPARGAAHVLVELLLDGALLAGGHDTGGFDATWAALARADVNARSVVAEGHETRWTQFLGMLTTRLEPARYAEPAYAVERVAGTLARRPRLALTPEEQAAVAAVAGPTALEVTGAADEVLEAIGLHLVSIM